MPVIANNQPAPPPPAPGVTSTPVTLPAPQNNLLSAQSILGALYTARLTIASQGFAAVTIDGQMVQYTSHAAIDTAILFWERKVALLSNKRRRVNHLRLDRF